MLSDVSSCGATYGVLASTQAFSSGIGGIWQMPFETYRSEFFLAQQNPTT